MWRAQQQCLDERYMNSVYYRHNQTHFKHLFHRISSNKGISRIYWNLLMFFCCSLYVLWLNKHSFYCDWKVFLVILSRDAVWLKPSLLLALVSLAGDGFNQTGRDALSGAMMSAVLWTLFYNTCFILISFWSKIAETMLVFTA